MENIKTLLPLILMAFFFIAIIVTLVIMGVKSILNKKGYSGICEKNGWTFGTEEVSAELELMLTSSLFTVKSSPRGKHTLKDVIRGTFNGVDFYFANYTYTVKRIQGHGIHDEYSIFVTIRKTPGPSGWFVKAPKAVMNLMVSVTGGELKVPDMPEWKWVMTPDQSVLNDLVKGQESIPELESLLGNQDTLFFFPDIVVWSVKNFQRPANLEKLLLRFVEILKLTDG